MASTDKAVLAQVYKWLTWMRMNDSMLKALCL